MSWFPFLFMLLVLFHCLEEIAFVLLNGLCNVFAIIIVFFEPSVEGFLFSLNISCKWKITMANHLLLMVVILHYWISTCMLLSLHIYVSTEDVCEKLSFVFVDDNDK